MNFFTIFAVSSLTDIDRGKGYLFILILNSQIMCRLLLLISGSWSRMLAVTDLENSS